MLAEKGANHISFHPDSNMVLLSSTQNATIILWKFENKRYRFRTIWKYNVHFSWGISGLFFRKNGTEIVVGSSTGITSIYNWDLDDGIFELKEENHESVVNIDLSRNGARLAILPYDHKISLWNTREGEEIARYPAPNRCLSIALSSDGQTMAAGSARRGERGKVHV